MVERRAHPNTDVHYGQGKHKRVSFDAKLPFGANKEDNELVYSYRYVSERSAQNQKSGFQFSLHRCSKTKLIEI